MEARIVLGRETIKKKEKTLKNKTTTTNMQLVGGPETKDKRWVSYFATSKSDVQPRIQWLGEVIPEPLRR